METVNMLGSFSNRMFQDLYIHYVGNSQLCLMGEIIFAIINLVLGVVVLCIFCSDGNKKP